MLSSLVPKGNDSGLSRWAPSCYGPTKWKRGFNQKVARSTESREFVKRMCSRMYGSATKPNAAFLRRHNTISGNLSRDFTRRRTTYVSGPETTTPSDLCHPASSGL